LYTGPQIKKLGLVPNLALLGHSPNDIVAQLVPIMRGWSKIAAINAATKPMEFGLPAFFKSISFHCEFLGTLCNPEDRFDVSSHGRMLRELSKLIDEGKFTSIVTKREVLSVQSLSAGHKQIESGATIGKLVFTIPDVLE
jgi:NADPH:quinone reductase-like Zn-dependent oxidoreductase